MLNPNFPNHSGGVVHVRHVVRWGTLPETLLEDDRLSLDSRAVAAWLAIKPPGWQIVVPVLRKRMNLGKDRWQRIARELQTAGYLIRSCRPGVDGRWDWENIFDPTGVGQTGAGQSGSGGISPGAPVSGNPGAGACGNKVKTRKKYQDRTTTTAKAAGQAPELRLPALTQRHEGMLQTLLAGMPVDVAQAIVDEFAGVLDAVVQGRHEPIRSPRAWIKRLVEASLAGEFTPDFGSRRRQTAETDTARATGVAAAEAAAAAERAALGIPEMQSKDDALAAIGAVLRPGRGYR